jgi:ABC-type nitrate/sulfonate/bicarbonate transport system permease component
MSAAEAPARARASGVGVLARRALTGTASFVVLAFIWQGLASVMPPFAFPSLAEVGSRTFEILLSGTLFANVLATFARIMAGMVGAFLLGVLLASFMVRFRTVDGFLSPILGFFQGIPALSWVVFAIIWFRGSEFRIFFIMAITTLPAFSFQILDALRGMPTDLVEMVQSFRPSRRKMFTAMIFPAIFPDILTAWKVNIGNASRVVVVAELVGASDGIGYQLMQQQQLFDMAGALAWTMQIVIFVILMQQIIALVEAGALRYRATSERSL